MVKNFEDYIKCNCPYYISEDGTCKHDLAGCINKYTGIPSSQAVESGHTHVIQMCEIVYYKWLGWEFERIWEELNCDGDLERLIFQQSKFVSGLTHLYPDKRGIWMSYKILDKAMSD